MNFQSCYCNPKTTFTDRPSKHFLEITNRSLDYGKLPGKTEIEAMYSSGVMAGGEDQNSSRRRSDLTEKRWGSDVGSPRASFRWLDGPEA
jgi:hypothetical protein